jgi:hypothetical protein
VIGDCARFHISAFLILFCQAMCRDSRIVPGAAATEIELARRVKEFSFKETGYFICFLFFHPLSLKFTNVSLLIAHVICVLYKYHVL